MAITPRQVQLIKQSFAQVEPIADQAAEIFYNYLFQFAPEARPMFKGDMKSQGKKLMSTLKVAVKSLNNLEALLPVLQKLARDHVAYGVKAKHYTPVGNALLYALRDGLGPRFTTEVRQAWVDAYRLIAKVMKEAAYGHH